jgi:hypothetical protein
MLGMTPSRVEGNTLSVGGQYLERCAVSDVASWELACAYYAQGILDTYLQIQQFGLLKLDSCIPGGITAANVKDALVRYLQQNPDRRNQSVPFLLPFALKGSYPCPGTGNYPQERR